MSRRVVVIGCGEMAKVFCSPFTRRTDYCVAGFAIGGELLKKSTLLGRPAVPLEDVE